METTITGKTLLARLQFLDEQLGRAAAERVLAKLSPEDRRFGQYHGSLVAPHDPHVVMSRIGAMRRLYYADGEFAYEKTGPTSARIVVHGMATVTTPDCESTAGFYEVAIGRSGGSDVDVRHRCRLEGSADCLFDCAWQL